MRKVLSFVLVLALVLGSFSMAFAATPSDVVGTGHEEAVDVLMGLGVIDGYEDGTFKPDQAVTRAEMAKLIVVALGLEDYAVGTSMFSDMAGAGWAQGYVAYAASLGVVKGYPDGTFKPSQTVTYDEAAAMIVRALGYTDESLTGTWPANYVVKAKALGILDGIKAMAGGANRGDIAEMLYNALSLDIGYVNKDGDFVANDTTDDRSQPDNMLIRLGAQFVAADDEDALDAVDQWSIIYGDEDTAINLRAFVGAYADRYLNDDDEIIMVLPVSDFLVGEYDEDADEFSTDDVDFNADDVSGATVDYFYNGVLYSDVSLQYMEDHGTITIAVDYSGKTLKEIYTIAEWDVTEHAFVDDSDLDDVADDMEMFGYEFALNDDDEIDAWSFEIVGADSLDAIEEDNVVYIYADDEDEYIRKVAVGTEVVEGEITRVSSDDEYTINGTKYEMAEVVDGASEDVAAGDEVKAYLDAYGDVYSFELTEGTADDFAVALDYDNGEDGLNGDSAVVKLFLNDGTDEVFDLDDKAMTADKEDDVYLLDSNLDWNIDPTVNLVLYGVDDDGIIDTMDVFSADDTYYTTESYMWVGALTDDITAKGYFDGKAIASDAVIFSAESLTATDEDDYDVLTLDDVKDTDDVYATYVLDLETNKIVAMIMEGGTTSDDSYGVLTDYASVSGDYDYEVTALIDGEEVTENADEDVRDAYLAADMAFYVLSYDAAGAFKDAVDITDSDDFDWDWGDADFGMVLVTGAAAEYDYNDDETIDGYTIDNDVIVYLYDDGYDVGNLSDVDGDEAVVLIDLDGDKVVDVVLYGDVVYNYYD